MTFNNNIYSIKSDHFSVKHNIEQAIHHSRYDIPGEGQGDAACTHTTIDNGIE